MQLDLAGMHQLAAGQGIDPETLDAALSEALRLAYLKTPHAAKHARVELDPRAGSFTVWAQDEIPGEPTEDDPHPAPTLGEEYDDSDGPALYIYYARQGERIFDIARRYHARARDLAAANHLDTNGDPPQELTTDTACLLIPAAL